MNMNLNYNMNNNTNIKDNRQVINKQLMENNTLTSGSAEDGIGLEQ